MLLQRSQGLAAVQRGLPLAEQVQVWPVNKENARQCCPSCLLFASLRRRFFPEMPRSASNGRLKAVFPARAPIVDDVFLLVHGKVVKSIRFREIATGLAKFQ